MITRVGDDSDVAQWLSLRTDKLIHRSGLAASNTEASAKLKSGAVRVAGHVLSGRDIVIICTNHEFDLRVGRRDVRVRVII